MPDKFDDITDGEWAEIDALPTRLGNPYICSCLFDDLNDIKITFTAIEEHQRQRSTCEFVGSLTVTPVK